MKARAVAIIIDRAAQRVLLIHRWRDGLEYYVMPGGKIENGETPQQACIREAREETGLHITLGPQVAQLLNLGRVETYFLASSFSGELALGFPERDWQTDSNVYRLEWVPARDLPATRLLPVEIHRILLDLVGQ